MGLTPYKAMDAQRFDPLQRKTPPPSNTPTSKQTMGQGHGVITQSDLSAYAVRDTVGGIWQDHEVVVVPPLSSELNDLSSLTSTSTSSASSHAPTDTPASSFLASHSHARDVPADMIITRTIMHPPQASASRFFASPPSSSYHASSTHALLSSSPSTAPPHVSRPNRIASPHSSRPTSPVLQALNCFKNSSAFQSDTDEVLPQANARPALYVTVAQTREQYADAMALKELVEAVYPVAAARRT